jgi:hypothetical protein
MCVYDIVGLQYFDIHDDVNVYVTRSFCVSAGFLDHQQSDSAAHIAAVQTSLASALALHAPALPALPAAGARAPPLSAASAGMHLVLV